MHLPRRKLSNPPNNTRQHTRHDRRRRCNPRNPRNHTSERRGTDPGNQRRDRSVLRPADNAPEDELREITDCAEEGAGAEAGLGAASDGGGVDEVGEVAAGVFEGRGLLLVEGLVVGFRVVG